MPTALWIVIFNEDVLRHIGSNDERGFDEDDAVAVVFGWFGPVSVRYARNDRNQDRWHCWAPYDEEGDLAVVVVRKAAARDLDRDDAFSIDESDNRVSAPLLGHLSDRMVVPVSMAGMEPDEKLRYEAWRRMKKKVKERAPKTTEAPVAPGFDSDEEESEFWKTHSVLDYEHVDVSDEVEIVPGAVWSGRR